ncbi:hypothetical protein QBC34DRAFT_386528 [Podospora aff. communis PSN243]|uniref:Uncharacterized protein n=1 Tax=Podospora aff. communis PSN243 TaxID=3040156 RepID=A0AAV9G6N0_9PEZI|nr:hypothetical protein QBC34DRAFT_386528 [Podospora aff. communis PSN243]
MSEFTPSAPPVGQPSSCYSEARGFLTDNIGELARHRNQTTPATSWGGDANPIPPQVLKEYWLRLYNRADSSIYQSIRKVVKKEDKPEDGDASGAQAGRTEVGGGSVPAGGQGVSDNPVGGQGVSGNPAGDTAANSIRDEVLRIRARLRDCGEVWSLSLELLIRDLVGADKLHSSGGPAAVRKRASLRETREL